ncbi:MAG: DUF4188 domain-containing protein [Streptosporangiales bacterium]|nr:DUF4188 domain-containing protein [Streptosporangiales bacterium]
MTEAQLRKGRWTAEIEGDFVVFLIGMRINRLRSMRQWLPVFKAMPAMLRELSTDPESGLLGYRLMVAGPRSPMLVQYWRSFEHLRRYAGDPDRRHRPAWLAFFKDSWKDGSVGIWHETYVVPAGSYECVYGNMPPMGLGRAGELVSVDKRTATAAQRLGQG